MQAPTVNIKNRLSEMGRTVGWFHRQLELVTGRKINRATVYKWLDNSRSMPFYAVTASTTVLGMNLRDLLA